MVTLLVISTGVHWSVPAIVSIIGLMLLFWHMLQRGRRRKRSSSGRYTNL